MKIHEITKDYDLIGVSTGSSATINKDALVIDGAKFVSKQTALQEIYTVLGFEQYIPYANYDGLDELIAPESWPELNSLALRIVNADGIGRIGDKDLRGLLLIFQSAIKNWSISNKRLSVELVV